MPYTSEELKSKQSYQNIIEADKNELKKFFEDEELKAQQSGSTMDAIKTLRDEEGFLLSYEDPENKGSTYPSNILFTRIKMEYYSTIGPEVTNKLEEERTFSNELRPIPDSSIPDKDLLKSKQAELDALINQNKLKQESLDVTQNTLQETIDALNAKIEELNQG